MRARQFLKRSVTLRQSDNPAFRVDQIGRSNDSRWCYVVTKTKNTLEVKIGAQLTPREVDALIDDGCEVIVTGDE